MTGLTGAWEVVAGVLPGEPLKEYTKRFLYTSDDAEKDRQNNDDGEPTNVFTEKMQQAYDYAMQITNPSKVNWVRVDFIWF